MSIAASAIEIWKSANRGGFTIEQQNVQTTWQVKACTPIVKARDYLQVQYSMYRAEAV